MTNLQTFLSMNEDRKAKCEMQYQLNKNSNILTELSQVWNVKFDDDSPSQFEWKQPLQTTLVLTGGEQHCLSFEEVFYPKGHGMIWKNYF